MYHQSTSRNHIHQYNSFMNYLYILTYNSWISFSFYATRNFFVLWEANFGQSQPEQVVLN